MKDKKHNRRYLLLLAMLATATLASAQNITGRIIDEQSLSMPFVNVVLVNRADSAFVAGAMTKEDGTFCISTDKQDGLLKVSSIGYITMYVDARQGNVGDIQMQPDTQTLGEVVVKGDRPQYKMTTGGMTVDIQNSLLKDVGTADDVLAKLPQVQGSDGNFTVFAKGTPEIYINNKKVRNAQQELKQLKSTDIKSIDVITSPGARYNAEVQSVIRIKTIRRQGDGMSAEAYGQVKRNNKWTTYDDVTVKHRRGGLEVFGTLELTNGNHSEDNTVTTDTHANGNHVSIRQYAPNTFWYTEMGGKLGASYEFDEENSIGFSYELNGSLYQGGEAVCEQTITRNNMLEGNIDQFMGITAADRPLHAANIYYVGKAGKLGIDFNGSWIWKKSTRDGVSTEHSLQLAGQDMHTYNVNRNRLLAGKLVLTYPLWKGEFSFGSEATRSNSHGTYRNVELIVPPSDDEIHESNIAGFAEYQLRLGEWSVGGGLRYEASTSLKATSPSMYTGANYTLPTTMSTASATPVLYLTLSNDPATMQGKVTNKKNGAAVEGASIVLTSGNVQYSATTDAEGMYSIEVIQTGLEYDMTAEKEGFFPQTGKISFADGNITKDIELIESKDLFIAEYDIPAEAVENHNYKASIKIENVNATPFAADAYTVKFYFNDEVYDVETVEIPAGGTVELTTEDVVIYKAISTGGNKAMTIWGTEAYFEVMFGEETLTTDKVDVSVNSEELVSEVSVGEYNNDKHWYLSAPD